MNRTEPKLLIADDDRGFRESLREVFARQGYTTKLAADGCEAVEIIQEDSDLDLVLLDVHMPRLSGLEALEQIRGIQQYLDASTTLPCILMSAKMDEAITLRAQQLGISSLLSKPFRLRDLTSTVESILHTAYGWKRL